MIYEPVRRILLAGSHIKAPSPRTHTNNTLIEPAHRLGVDGLLLNFGQWAGRW